MNTINHCCEQCKKFQSSGSLVEGFFVCTIPSCGCHKMLVGKSTNTEWEKEFDARAHSVTEDKAFIRSLLSRQLVTEINQLKEKVVLLRMQGNKFEAPEDVWRRNGINEILSQVEEMIDKTMI